MTESDIRAKSITEDDIRVACKRKDNAFVDRMWWSAEASASKNRLLAVRSKEITNTGIVCMGEYFALYLEEDSPEVAGTLTRDAVRARLEELYEQQHTATGKERASIASLIKNLKPYENGPPVPKILKKGRKPNHKSSATYDKMVHQIENKCEYWRQHGVCMMLKSRTGGNPNQIAALPIELKLVWIGGWIKTTKTIEACVVGRRWLQLAKEIAAHQAKNKTFGIHPQAITDLEAIVTRYEHKRGLDTGEGILANFNASPVVFIDPLSPVPFPNVDILRGGTRAEFGFLNEFQIEFIDALCREYKKATSSKSTGSRPQLWIVGNVGVGKSTAVPLAAVKLQSIERNSRIVVICPKWWAVFDMVGICLTLGIPVSIVDKNLKEQLSWQTCGRRPHQKTPIVTVGIPEFICPFLKGRDVSKWVIALDEATQSPSQITLDLLKMPFHASVLISANLPIDRESGSPIKMKMPAWDAAMITRNINPNPIIIDSSNTPVGMKVVHKGKITLDPLKEISSPQELSKFVKHLEIFPSLRRFFTINELLRILKWYSGTADRFLVSYRRSSYFDQSTVFDILQDIIVNGANVSKNLPDHEILPLNLSFDPSTIFGLIEGLRGGLESIGQMLFYTPDPRKAMEEVILSVVDLAKWSEAQQRYSQDVQEVELIKRKEMHAFEAARAKAKSRSKSGDDDMDLAHIEQERAEISDRCIESYINYVPRKIRALVPKTPDLNYRIREILEDDTLTPIEAIGLVLGLGAYIHSAKGSSYTSHVQTRATSGNMRVVFSSLDPNKGAVFALNAQFKAAAFDDAYFENPSNNLQWGIMYQALGRVGRRGQSYHATCFLGSNGVNHMRKLWNGEADVSFVPERDAFEQLASK